MDNKQLVFNGLKAFLDGWYNDMEEKAYPFVSNLDFEERQKIYEGTRDDADLRVHGFSEGRVFGRYVDQYPFGNDFAARQKFAIEQSEVLKNVFSIVEKETYLSYKPLLELFKRVCIGLEIQIDGDVKAKGRKLKAVHSAIDTVYPIVIRIKTALEERGMTDGQIFKRHCNLCTSNDENKFNN